MKTEEKKAHNNSNKFFFQCFPMRNLWQCIGKMRFDLFKVFNTHALLLWTCARTTILLIMHWSLTILIIFLSLECIVHNWIISSNCMVILTLFIRLIDSICETMTVFFEIRSTHDWLQQQQQQQNLILLNGRSHIVLRHFTGVSYSFQSISLAYTHTLKRCSEQSILYCSTCLHSHDEFAFHGLDGCIIEDGATEY